MNYICCGSSCTVKTSVETTQILYRINIAVVTPCIQSHENHDNSQNDKNMYERKLYEVFVNHPMTAICVYTETHILPQ